MISFIYTVSISLAMFLVSIISYKRYKISSFLWIGALCVLLIGGHFVRSHNDKIQNRVDMNTQFSEIQKEWRVINTLNSPSVPSESTFDPSRNTYILEKIEHGAIVRARIGPDSRMRISEWRVVGLVQPSDKKEK